MVKLTAMRQKVVEERLEQLNKMQAKLYSSMENVMVEKKLGGSGGLSIFEQLKLKLNFSKTSNSKMSSADKLNYSKEFFKDIRDYRNKVMNDPGYKAVLRDIDDQIKAIKAEMDQIDEEMNRAPDEEKKKALDARKVELDKKLD